ncbi:MAG: tRNA threonylcarbamoyladenosine dehydratase [Bacteroidales bacterium]|nr:tRNA threonylcarbamoyladenosine dehydratase [Bacteroidales bacterium]
MTHYDWQQRTELLIGSEQLEKLHHSHVLIVGLGGVGAYAAEQLCRAGIGEMTSVDADTVDDSNRNRQLPALISTIGKEKVEVMAERLLQINPDLKLHTLREFVRDEGTIALLEQAPYDYVVDAIDSLSPKVFLIYHALQRQLKVVSAMGAGGKIDPMQVKVAPIEKTYQCRLAHAIRKRLHRMGIKKGFKAVFSPEPVPEEAVEIDANPDINKLSTVGTISYMPAIFGCMAASVVIRDLIGR